MRRHARVDVLSIVTFNYWFRERDANSQIFLIDVHKYRIYDDKSAIIMPKTIVSDFNYGRDIEASIFAVEYVAEMIAHKVGIANLQIDRMMGMAVNPNWDSTISDIVAEFNAVGCFITTVIIIRVTKLNIIFEVIKSNSAISPNLQLV